METSDGVVNFHKMLFEVPGGWGCGDDVSTTGAVNEVEPVPGLNWVVASNLFTNILERLMSRSLLFFDPASDGLGLLPRSIQHWLNVSPLGFG